jgi:hypothetical protein
MKRGMLTLTIIGLLVLMLGTSAVMASPTATEITRSVIGGGGGESTSGAYTLSGTIGQPVVGTGSTSPYELCSGYWCGLVTYQLFLPTVLRLGP